MIRFFIPVLAFLALATGATAQEAASPSERPAWSEEVIETFAQLPVQDGGRVKPLDTYAAFRLLRFNGKRTLKTPAGEKLLPSGWLLDCFFYPEVARTYAMFQVRDSAIVQGIGVRLEGKKKADRYSYDELLPAREKLFSEASRIGAIEEKRRGREEAQLYALALSVRDFEFLIHALDFTRAKLETSAAPVLSAFFEGRDVRGVAGFLSQVPRLQAELEGKLEAVPTDEERAVEQEAIAAVSSALSEAVETSSAFGDERFALDLYPPTHGEETWLDVSGATEHCFAHPDEALRALIAGWEALEAKKADPSAFQAELEAQLERTTAVVATRGLGEDRHIEREVAFYRMDYFTKALVFYLLAFLVLCATWLSPRLAFLDKGVWGVSLLATGLVVAGVVQRCIIRERPPISTLYETILFVAGTGALLLFLVELFTRRRVALSLAPLWGAAGLFLAMKYELKEAATANDTMPSLVAVLDTNFWLATHVTSITLGYSAGLVAAVLGTRWLLGMVLGHRRGDKEHYRGITRMIYGVVCFGLFFSVVGTILGGVWANYSWGRFWGWDPKENGALLICLAEILILHLRLGGYVRDFGLAVLATLNGAVVAFSWWGVNLLNVGLHSYGFTEGVARALVTYYVVTALVVLVALVWRMATKSAASAVGNAHEA
jgi:ABC-type transport system involved in cytochrome c biogenesis permease subunit